MTDRLLTPDEVAARFGLRVQTLAKWRMLGLGPEFVKIGGRVRYLESVIDGWVDSRSRDETDKTRRRVRA